jgi:hypothetical protein
MQPVQLNFEGRRTRYATISINVEAGYRYELDGDVVTKTRIQPSATF